MSTYRSRSTRISVLFLTAMLCAAEAFAQSGLARIVHTPVTFGQQGRPITIDAYPENDDALGTLIEARVWFRPANKEVFDYEEMFRAGTNYSGEIPAAAVVSEGLVYYIEFIYSGGPEEVSLTYPPSLRA